MNHLQESNCNKAKCKSCIFKTDGFKLSQARLNEIHAYLGTFQSSHQCHITNLTCFGALEFQAALMYRMKYIPENSVASLLATAKQLLNFK